MNRYRLRSKEEMKQAWKEHWAVAPTLKSYNILESILCSAMLMTIIVIVGSLFKFNIAIGAITMGAILAAPVISFFTNGVKRWKK